MKTTLFNKVPVNVKSATVDNIVEALCSSPEMTRADIAEKSGVSLTTVCKVTDALISSGTVQQRIKAQADSSKRKPCGHLSVSRRLCTAVIDLSSPVYSVSIICGGESYFHYTHKYDPGADFEINLYSLLSRAFSQIRLKKGFCLQICVLYSDIHTSSVLPQAYLPNLCDKKMIDDAVYDVCERHPISYFSKAQALSSAVKFNIVSKADGFGGISYLFIGSSIFGAFIPQDNLPILCNPQNVIIDNNTIAEKFIKTCIGEHDLDLLLVKSVNFIDSAFGAKTLIIESDLYNIESSYIKSLERDFARMQLSAPLIYPVYLSAKDPGICVVSAARKAEADFLRSYITGSN